MTPTALKYLDYAALKRQFADCGLCSHHFYGEPAPEQVVIRDADGDYYLASIHRAGKVLIFDKGQKVDDGL